MNRQQCITVGIV